MTQFKPYYDGPSNSYVPKKPKSFFMSLGSVYRLGKSFLLEGTPEVSSRIASSFLWAGSTVFILSFLVFNVAQVRLGSKFPVPQAATAVSPSKPSGTSASAGAAPLSKSTKDYGVTSGSGDSTPNKASGRDWVDVTDKFVDWFTKLIGSAVAVFGAFALYRNSGKSKRASR